MIVVTMLPILIMPDTSIEPEDECLPEARDSATKSVDLYEFQELWEGVPDAARRRRPLLGPWVDIRPRVRLVEQGSEAAPASLQDCDQLLKLLLRRKANPLGRDQRTELR